MMATNIEKINRLKELSAKLDAWPPASAHLAIHPAFDPDRPFDDDGFEIEAMYEPLQGFQKPQGTADDDAPDNHRNAPKPDPACLYGIVGDVAHAGGDTTEANPYAVAANFIAFMSCAVGRGPFMYVGNIWHHSRQFMLHIGRSGKGRKGDAVSLIGRIEHALRRLCADVVPQVHRGGLSSREGLVFMIHDGYTEGKNEVEAIHDKRLMVIESEFSNVLHQSKRDGNTLSPALRDAWDGVSMKPATKTSRMWATDPHISLIGAVTPSELLGLMASRELTNGFANRFLMFWAERTKMLAFPRATPQAVIDALAQRVLEVLQFCQADRWAEKDNMQVELSPDARRRYELLYLGELNDGSAGDRINTLIERRAPMLLRLAMLFALCDLQTTVEVHHINAALAWIRYSVDSIKFIFGSAEDEATVAKTNDAAKKVIDHLLKNSQATRWELIRDCFHNHIKKSEIDQALDELLASTPPQVAVEAVPRKGGGVGRSSKLYKLPEKSAKSAKYEDSCGLQADSEHCEVSEVLRSKLLPNEVAAPNFADFADFADPINQAATRMDKHTSHTSLTSHHDLENDADEEAL